MAWASAGGSPPRSSSLPTTGKLGGTSKRGVREDEGGVCGARGHEEAIVDTLRGLGARTALAAQLRPSSPQISQVLFFANDATPFVQGFPPFSITLEPFSGGGGTLPPPVPLLPTVRRPLPARARTLPALLRTRRGLHGSVPRALDFVAVSPWTASHSLCASSCARLA